MNNKDTPKKSMGELLKEKVAQRGSGYINVSLEGDDHIRVEFLGVEPSEGMVQFMRNERMDKKKGGYMGKRNQMQKVVGACGSHMEGVWVEKVPQFSIDLVQPLKSRLRFMGPNQQVVSMQYDLNDKMKDLRTELPYDVVQAMLHYQMEGVQFGLDRHGRILLADEMGVGKTLQALCIAYLFRPAWPLLIICPASLRLTWKDEIAKWFPRLTSLQLIESSKDVLNRSAQIVVVSYDMAVRCLSKLHSTYKFGIAIADEAHYLRSYKSQRNQTIAPFLAGLKHVLLLTGTPIMNQPKELYSLLRILRPDACPTFPPYGLRFCHPKPSPWNPQSVDFTGSSNPTELHAILKTVMIRRLKNQVLTQLPAKRRQKLVVKVEPKYQEQAQQILKEAKMGSVDEVVQSLGDNQTGPLWGCFSQLYQATAEAKKGPVLEQLTQMLMAGCKLLVFAYHRTMLDAIEATVKASKVPYIRIDGSTPVQARYQAVETFQKKAQVQVAVLSMAVAGVGISLTAAHHILFAEMNWTPALLEQAEDRAHRLGQAHSVNIYYVYALGTLDERLYAKLLQKTRMSEQVVDGVTDTGRLHYIRPISTPQDILQKKLKVESSLALYFTKSKQKTDQQNQITPDQNEQQQQGEQDEKDNKKDVQDKRREDNNQENGKEDNIQEKGKGEIIQEQGGKEHIQQGGQGENIKKKREDDIMQEEGKDETIIENRDGNSIQEEGGRDTTQEGGGGEQNRESAGEQNGKSAYNGDRPVNGESVDRPEQQNEMQVIDIDSSPVGPYQDGQMVDIEILIDFI